MSSGRIELVLRAPEGDRRDNPFAPPPEGTPDRPWQPRHPAGAPTGTAEGPGAALAEPGSAAGSGVSSGSGSGSDDASGSGTGPAGPGRGGSGQGGDPQGPAGTPPVRGGQWSNRQPQSGRPDPFTRGGGPAPSGPQGQGPRFDPTDPAQRRSRYALVCGGWGLIFALLGWTAVALLLGALALNWGISALRMSPEDRATARAQAASALAEATQTPRPAPPAPGPDAQRSFLTAAWSGIIASGVALAIVAATYGFQFAYRNYYDCKADALTAPASHACQKLLPSPLRGLPTLR